MKRLILAAFMVLFAGVVMPLRAQQTPAPGVTPQSLEDWLTAGQPGLVIVTNAASIMRESFPLTATVLEQQHFIAWDYLVRALNRGLEGGDSGLEAQRSAIDLIRSTASLKTGLLANSTSDELAALAELAITLLGDIRAMEDEATCKAVVLDGVEALMQSARWEEYRARYDAVLAAYFTAARAGSEDPERAPYPVETDLLAQQLDAMNFGDWRQLTTDPGAVSSPCGIIMAILREASDSSEPTRRRLLAVVTGSLSQL